MASRGIPLRAATLSEIPRGVPRPMYDRTAVITLLFSHRSLTLGPTGQLGRLVCPP